eukprot:6206127-Pleurochrysis_carterae.AAC.2
MTTTAICEAQFGCQYLCIFPFFTLAWKRRRGARPRYSSLLSAWLQWRVLLRLPPKERRVVGEVWRRRENNVGLGGERRPEWVRHVPDSRGGKDNDNGLARRLVARGDLQRRTTSVLITIIREETVLLYSDCFEGERTGMWDVGRMQTSMLACIENEGTEQFGQLWDGSRRKGV